MALYRQIHTHIWKDEWFLDLDAEEKLLFIYLFSNELSSVAGIYKIPLKVITFETGLDKAFVTKTLAKFGKAGKAYYEDGIAWVVNLRKYNESSSSKVQTRIDTDLSMIPDCPLKTRYVAHNGGQDTLSATADTLSADSAEQEQEQEKEHTDSPPSGGGESEKARHDRIRGNLETHFANVTGIEPPKRATKKQKAAAAELWWTPLRDIAVLAEWDEDYATELIDKTYDKMHGDNLAITCPKSIVNMARAMHGERRRVGRDVLRVVV